MNLIHLKYAVEVEKTRSITKAAENLYMGQPNLSRAIKELEESLGITLFKRTSKGIKPTDQGAEFLSYAKSILSQIEELEDLYKTKKQEKLTFSISVPRASYISHALTSMVAGLDQSKELEINYKETNSLRAINNLLQNNYNLGIIRYHAPFEKYFAAMLKEKNIKHELIWEFEYLALMSMDHPLANSIDLSYKELSKYIEIAHGDPYVPSLPITEVKKSELPDLVNKRILVYERGSQFDLLNTVPNTYIWVSPVPRDILKRYSLVQKPCKDSNRKYRDVLIYRDNYNFNNIDCDFVEELLKVKNKLVDLK